MRWPSAVAPDAAAELRAGVDALAAAGHAPAWIWVFDDTWRLAAAHAAHLGWFLGEDPLLPPHFWAWRIDGADDAGWPPHRDWSVPAIRDGVTIGLTVWVPLSDVGLDDGCIGLLRGDRDDFAAVDGDRALDPRDIRMLPVDAGDALVWRADALHWGGRPSRFAAGPRLSLAFEAQSAAFAPAAEPLSTLSPPPPPDQRLAAIAARMARYGVIDATRS